MKNILVLTMDKKIKDTEKLVFSHDDYDYNYSNSENENIPNESTKKTC